VIAFLFSDEKYQDKLQTYGIENFMLVVNVINYLIVVGFIYVFYKNYRSISTLDSTSKLMQSIVSTRRTVQNYIWYNLFIITLTIVISIVMMFSHNQDLISLMNKQVAEGHETVFICFCVAISLVFIAVIIGVFWLFYKLLYGILLKKLFANYKELKAIEL
jgi:flagellar biosynthesis protein FlhB